MSHPESVWTARRFVTKSVNWWLNHHPERIDTLYCVHGRALNLHCPKCEAGVEWEASSSEST